MAKSLEEIKNEIALRKNEIATTEYQDEETAEVLSNKKKELLRSDEALSIAEKISSEDIKASFASEASKINERNVATAEREFGTETRKRRLERLNAEMDLQHKYNMMMLNENGKHKQMLDKRKKLVEKYSYLYNEKDCIDAVDGEGNTYKVPKDFSYSVTVNKFRQFGRNFSKLDKPFLQTIKWVLIVGGIIIGVLLLKKFGVLN